MTTMAMDLGSLHHARRSLESAGATLDGLAASPPSGDYGDAAALVLLLLGLQAETTALLAGEAQLLATGIAWCAADVQCTDSEQAVDLLGLGVGP